MFHRIYVEDYLDILVAAMEKGRPGQAYNVVDQAPHTPAEYYNEMARMLGVPPLIPSSSDPPAVPAVVRYQNEKLLREFGLALRFPTYREGLLDGFQKAEELKAREGKLRFPFPQKYLVPRSRS
ncbi:MAG: hypothetical protein MPW15_01120 [Candidatus Manganitrophus sp.]|nr:hypothetical protein [Candidatus Manganitrophus sp.]